MDSEKIGRILAVTEILAADVQDIKKNMVTRREFEGRVREHDDFRSGIRALDKKVDTLESYYDQNHIMRKVFDRFLFLAVGAAVAALFSLFGA